MNDNREFIEEFLVESGENLDQLDRDLIALEERPDDPQRLASIFRTVHTIKGNSGFFGFSKLGALTHSGEHLLGRLRDGKIRLNDRVTGTLYSMVDAVRSILNAIEATGVEGEQDFRELSQTLTAVAAEDEPEPMPPPLPTAPPASALQPEAAAQRPDPSVPQPDPSVPQRDPSVPQRDTSAPQREASAPDSPAPAQTPAAQGPATQSPKGPVSEPAKPALPAAETSIRVDVGLLASVLDLVGELVLARNELRSIEITDPALEGVIQRINTVTNSLQEAAVKTRMQPIEHVFNRFPRTVRDLAVACGREVQLVIDGADTELDRSLIESIRDPLTHLVRNAVDHGIESPADRQAKGKPRAGRLLLRAFHESGQVTIEVQDDGAGIPVEAVRAKAVARGLIDADTAALLPDDRVLQFIFEPGFSTAAQVTSVSGRGVGMDVVKTNIEAIGGTVDIASRPGLGTTVRVRVPLTLAIIPSLVVRCADERFAMPQAAVGELVSLRTDGGPKIEGLAGAAVIRVRGRLVPVIFLDEFLGLRTTTAARDNGTVVLVRVDDHEFGLVVDGTQTVSLPADGSDVRQGQGHTGTVTETASLTTIVVKPIGSLLTQLGIYSGATVLGDGGVVLILDLRGILRVADLPPLEHRGEEAGGLVNRIADSYLVCRTGNGRRIAVPIDSVVRLEQFQATDMQAVGNKRLVRRGDVFTPVIDADSLLGSVHDSGAGFVAGSVESSEQARVDHTRFEPDGDGDGSINLVVLDDHCSGVGIAVRQILDVGAAESPLQPSLAAAGVVGTLAVGGLATEVLDVAALMLPGGMPHAGPPLPVFSSNTVTDSHS
jgi:two-component system chemotaxis sensor kinase CheA